MFLFISTFKRGSFCVLFVYELKKGKKEESDIQQQQQQQLRKKRTNDK